MATPWVLFLLTFLTIACFSLSSKPNAINVTNTPASSFGDDDDPLAAAASRTRSRHLNSLITSILKADAKWLFLKIFGKNKIPKVNLYKPKPPRFNFRKPDPERKSGKRFKPKKPDEESSLVKIPLFPPSFGAYSMSLRFGTPPQTMSFTLDTGGGLVWFPCTDSYRCSNCSFQNTDPTKIPTFKPDHSASSMKMVYCNSNSCGWIHGPGIKSKCELFGPCPDYERMYGTWSTDGISIASTSGHLLLEILEESVADFLVGCSNSSTHQPLGVAGFGDAPESLPAQLELAKFSYCLLPHLYDDTRQSTDLILDPAAELETQGLSYTRLIPGPTILSGFHFYGNGGTVLDTSSPYTYLERSIYKSVSGEFEKQMDRYARAADVGVLGPCFQLLPDDKLVYYPTLTLLFEGGAQMELSMYNYLLLDDAENSVCLSFVTDVVGGSGLNVALSGGPSIILGNYMQQSFYMEYDLDNSRLGFQKQAC
ncbi:probable aspartyl protease At4g16563 [Corylus avellana]|uniref:probable aspartyl protease At4g16563 n=1 Tax=Corylus avellana TaxID=13451 RepID=UPI00286BFFE8|nr:probable aspartyl protease At4g16563 [Corylus avellana]